MGLHENPSSMLKESIPEYLEAARLCLFKKADSKCNIEESDNCIGYPCALLLFSIIDSIGSYFRGNKEFKVIIENVDYSIDKKPDFNSFFILNSKYFQLELSMKTISEVYTKFRSELSHNSLLGKNSILYPNNKMVNLHLNSNFIDTPIIEKLDTNSNTIYLISLFELFNCCQNAVNQFLNEIDIIVPNSRLGKSFH